MRSSTSREFGSARDAWLRALQATASLDAQPHRTLPALLDEICQREGERVALVSTSEVWTFTELGKRIGRYAHWAKASGVRHGDCVALLMPNCLEYLAIWLGVTKVGGVVALLNTSLKADALAHSIEAAHATKAIVHGGMIDQFLSAVPLLSSQIGLWSFGDSGRGLPRVDGDATVEATNASDGSADVTLKDRALYIYTSGTTGMPKAAILSHRRLITWSLWYSGLLGATRDDRMYDCLPLYHSVGGVVATGALLAVGGSVFIRDRFSATSFWSDIQDHDCTMFQYIGELCRYLLNAPDPQWDRPHRIRVCCGNGLRADVWEPFQKKFAIPAIVEFYASTEGNVSLYNLEGKVGSIGRLPAFSPRRNDLALIRLDAENGPIRGEDGFCVVAEAGEVGEAVGKIADADVRAGGEFEGYTSRADTEKKILRDVFKPGDAWFRTGDLMLKDLQGFYYFSDRLGDTYRWRGENVSTQQLSEILGRAPGVLEALVYGVPVPKAEGRAGMALLVVADSFDLGGFGHYVEETLPSYARPLFLRLRESIDVTSTFKYKKNDLIDEGYDPKRTRDPLYIWDIEIKVYRPLDRETFDRVSSGGHAW